MKNKILFIASIAIFISTSKISAQVVTTLPITAVSFPKEVVPVDAGTIEFDAKMTDFSGYIPSGGVEPHFFEIYDGTSTYHIGFNGNDGAADGGLVGRVGSNFSCGTGSFGAWYFEDIYEAGEVDQWHHYKFVWDKDGFPQGNNTRKVDIYIDDVLNSSHWEKDGDETILQPTDGTFNLITCDNISDLPGVVAIDELKIYDGDGNLVLYNKLGSQQEIENSEVGLNGSFNGFGDAHFVPGIDGDAVEANPVLGLGTGVSSCNAPAGLTVVNITATTAKLKWNAVAGAEGYTVRYKVASTNGWKYGTTYGHSKPISGLLPNTVYKWEVKTFCHIDPPYIKSDWSSKQQFTTLAENSGADQYFTVPDGVTQLTVKLWGAGGAGGNYDPCPAYGGGGGYVTGTIIVTPGETLTIVVGGKGETGSGAGAYGGGGGKQSGAGGRGGGRSAVVRGDDDIITAGGGGGGGGGCYAEGETISRGGGGGGIEGTPSYWVPYSGEPGTNSHPGAAGYNPFQGTFGGNPGIGHDGGYAGIGDNGYNGSGGGGYYGGGSGTDWGDGGG
ncbi:MAG TPA: fibronectin type III domain-containing protein, partial [Chitinophagales bacterium]|nr:fibronectin type III domain-containing protein [Chitinophagales bacterium]